MDVAQLVELGGMGHQPRVVVGHKVMDRLAREDGGRGTTDLHLGEMDVVLRVHRDRHMDGVLGSPPPLALDEGRVGLVDRAVDRGRGGRGVKRPLHLRGDLLQEVPYRASRNPETDRPLEGFGSIPERRAGGHLGGGETELGSVAPLPEPEGGEQRGERAAMEAVVDPSGAELGGPQVGEEPSGAGAMADESRSSVREDEPTEFLEKELLHLLEDGAQGIHAAVVGSVQQLGKLYRSDFFYLHGPLLLLGSWWSPPEERFPRRLPIFAHYQNRAMLPVASARCSKTSHRRIAAP